MDGNASKTQSGLRAEVEHDNATPTVAPAAPRCGINYDRFVTHQPEKQGKIKGPMLRVKRRGNLEDGGFQSKCNGPNGLFLRLNNIQRLESYQLDDLPPGGGKAAAKRLARLHFNFLRVKRDGALRQLASH